MSEPTWTFAPNGNGEEHGFHNPGVETFKDNLERYLAREAIQNCIDARHDKSKAVSVTFELLNIKRDEIPGMNELAYALKQCSAYWAKDERARAFFDRAHKLAQAKFVTCLRIGDTNTTGVPGSDTDRDEGWYNLVRSCGSSAKGIGAGGSFGLGKHAPFAASRLLTVIYSTRVVDGSSAFQGVTRLATHDGQKVRRQPTGFLGGPDGRSIRNKKDIPRVFRREQKGTDVYVLGYNAASEWEVEIIYSVLENFWPAIHRGILTVTVGETTVSKRNLASLLTHYSVNYNDFEAHFYYRAYTDPKAEQSHQLPLLGKVCTFFLAGDQMFPNRVAMVRGTGMVVYHRRGRSRVPYVGVFECRNETGNEALRQMEPPRHDDWNPDLPEKGAKRKEKKELDDLIIERIKGLAPASTEKIIAIPDLNQYLPDDGDSPEEAFDGATADGEGKNESFDQTSKMQVLQGKNMPKKQVSHPGGNDSGNDGDATDGDDSDGDKGGDSNEGDGGDKGSKGGNDGDGLPGDDKGRHLVDVRSRAFLTDPTAGAYAITIHPTQTRPVGDVLLTIAAVGDDSLPVPVRLQSARVPGGKKLEVPSLGRIGPVAFPKAAPLRVEVVLAEPRRLSLQVTAEEVLSDASE